MKEKIIITGTGRAGTTLLMKIFTDLGLDTGFDRHKLDSYPDQGLENLNLNNDTLIQKAPHFSLNIESINQRFNIRHVIIPIRDLNSSAQSRHRMGQRGANGGLWGANSIEEQKNYNATLIYNLTERIAALDIPHTFIHFPSFTKNSSILFSKLNWLWQSYKINQKTFEKTFNNTVDRSKIHNY